MQASIIQDNRWSAEERNWFWSCNLLEVFWWSHKIQARNWSYLRFHGSLKAWITTSVPKSPGKIHRFLYYRLYIYCTINIFPGTELFLYPLHLLFTTSFFQSLSFSFSLFVSVALLGRWSTPILFGCLVHGLHLCSKMVIFRVVKITPCVSSL